MRAVMVIVFPALPDDNDALAETFAETFAAVSRALAPVTQVREGRLIAAIKDSADAILRAAES